MHKSILAVRCAIAIATAAAITGCSEGTLAPGNARAHVAVAVRVERASASSTAAPLDIGITVSYVRNAGTKVAIGSGVTTVASGTGSADVPVEVDLGACLADADRVGSGEVCPIVISAVLSRSGAALDSTSVGPVNASQGSVVTINAPLVLHELARLRLSWTGSAPGATGDTLRAGRTLALKAAAEDAAGTALPDRSVTWTSNAVTIATVDAQTGIVTPLAPGAATLTASAAGRTATFDARVYAAAQNVQFTGGDDQSVTLSNFGSTIVVNPVVRVTDAQGRPAAQVSVAFAVTVGGGQLAQATARTDSLGLTAAGAWTLAGTGVNTLRATASVLTPVTLNAYVPLDGLLAVGNSHTCLLAANGATSCWGSRNFGALGDNINNGTVSTRVTPIGSPTFTSIVSHAQTTCGTTATAATLCWGRVAVNDGSTNPMRLVPTPLSGAPFKGVGTGRLGGCYLSLAGRASCWGNNQAGEVGDSTLVTRFAATPVIGGLQFERIETSWMTNCGLTAAGTAYCWGRNLQQQPPLNNFAPAVIAGHQFVSIHGGGVHQCGLKANGEAWCWGTNDGGQLGDGTTTQPFAPVRATTLHFVRLATSTQANQPTLGKTCGITITGAGYCWGSNRTGELGNGQASLQELLPVRLQTTEAFVAIGMGDFHACAMTTDRRVFCWGDNLSGQLGNGSIAPGDSWFPIIVP